MSQKLCFVDNKENGNDEHRDTKEPNSPEANICHIKLKVDDPLVTRPGKTISDQCFQKMLDTMFG